MAVRLLSMFSIMIAELAGGVAGIVAIVDTGPYHRRIDGGDIAGIVAIVAGILVGWLLTIALTVRASSRAKARRIIDDAKREAALILAQAADKAMALCSLDGGRCPKCGNPRTGKFCPKCGAQGQAA